MSTLPFERISVIGLGYIGLPTAAMFASRGLEVVGVDVIPHVVDTINRGDVHIVEPDLSLVVRAAVRDGYLRATTIPEPAGAFLIAVPTPFKGSDHEPDLSYIKSAATAIAPVLERGNLVVLESTSPVGATEAMCEWLADARPDLSFPAADREFSDIHVAHCPERVLPGNVMRELVTNDRVIGGMTSACTDLASSLYSIFVTGKCIAASSPRVAEMAKLAENSFRDVNIAFANELSMICQKMDVDVWEIIALANRHPRVDILRPGPGVGGHCISVDPWFIVAAARDRARLIATARRVNDYKPTHVLQDVEKLVSKFISEHPERSTSDVCVAFYGLAFKPDIDDLRESPSVNIVERFISQSHGPVVVVEPNVDVLPSVLASASLLNVESALAKGDVHVVLVRHSEFLSAIDTKCPQVLDTVGLHV